MARVLLRERDEKKKGRAEHMISYFVSCEICTRKFIASHWPTNSPSPFICNIKLINFNKGYLHFLVQCKLFMFDIDHVSNHVCQ